MKSKNKKSVLLLSVLILMLVNTLTFAQNQNDKTEKKTNPAIEANAQCFKCHGHTKYEFKTSDSSKAERKRMWTNCIISEKEYYEGNHKTFQCTDCHSSDFKTFPHKGELHFEKKNSCLDCHVGDERWAKYKFEKINEDFQKSVHSSKHSEDFTCNMCHDPHTYKINASKNTNVLNTIAYDNAICLSCHADAKKYQFLTDKTNPNILKKHEWLPNQANHFANVRCIECHARVNDSLLVSHNIQPKEKAVKRCVECHSTNSLLLQSLYRYDKTDKLDKQGFFNGAILNNSYVIGANRNYYLNLISIIGMALVVVFVGVHATLRIAKRKKKH